MTIVGIKPLLIGLLLMSLMGIAGCESVIKWPMKSLPLKSLSVPIKYVRIEGVFQYLSKQEVQMALQSLVKAGFFDVDMQEIYSVIAAMPWVDTVTVKRIWPDTIDIKVHEKKPYARWGEKSLITEEGVIFTPRNLDQFESVARVSGPETQQVKVLEIMKGVKTALADQSMTLAEFSVNDRGAWKMKLVTGLEILLGRNEQLKKLQRFLKTLTVLKQEQIEQIAIVDLRYPNGYAVSWKDGVAEFDWKAIANPIPNNE